MTESKAHEFLGTTDDHGHFIGIDDVEPWMHKQWTNAVHVIEKSAYDQLQTELATLRQIKSSMSDIMDQKDKQIEDLKAREIALLALIQDSRKRIKSKDELLRECESQLEILINSFMVLRVADGPKKFAILRNIDDKISDALMVLKKLREGSDG